MPSCDFVFKLDNPIIRAVIVLPRAYDVDRVGKELRLCFDNISVFVGSNVYPPYAPIVDFKVRARAEWLDILKVVVVGAFLLSCSVFFMLSVLRNDCLIAFSRSVRPVRHSPAFCFAIYSP